MTGADALASAERAQLASADERRGSTVLSVRGLKLRPDPCGGFEVYLAGFRDRAEAEVFKAQAKDRGFDVALEIN